MNKKILTIIVGLLIIGILAYIAYSAREGDEEILVNNPSSHLDATYKIDDRDIKLVNGISVETIPDSSAQITTKYFGNEVKHDFDGDGREDIAFLVTQNGGGTGTFYYVVAALNKVDGFVGSEALFLGDRIAPQTTNMGKGNIIVVNYADRAPGESFADKPSMGKSIWLLLDKETLQFGEVAQNFEGEADPSRMTLSMKTWNWIRTEYNDGKQVTPNQTGKFTITLSKNNTFSATTDCNSMSGKYSTKQNAITFENIASTKMYCENSQEMDFVKSLTESASYHFTSKGELILDLKFDSGIVIFR